MSINAARGPNGPIALKASAALPAAGAYEAAPLLAAMVDIPQGWDYARIMIEYTEGAGGGQAAHKVYLSSGAVIAQDMAPDGTYSGWPGKAGTSAYCIEVTCRGASKIGIASAEVGVTGTPGTCASAVTFG